jgi:hypothetical protein
MRDDDVPAKTQVGLAEIKSRALGLAPRMRTALLLVDGVKSVRELEQLLAASGVKPGALQTLFEKGLISIPQDDSVSVPAATAAPEKSAIPEAISAPETVPAYDAAAAPEASPAPQAVPAPKASAAPAPQAAPPPKVTSAPKPAAAPRTVPTAKAAPAPEPAATPKAPPAPKPAPAAKAAPDTASTAKAAPTPKPAPAAKAPSTPKAVPAPQGAARPASHPPALTAVRLPVPAQSDEQDEAPEHEVQIFVPPPPPEDMKLLVARAHVANALDDRVDSYVLKQMVASCSSRAQLESLFDAAEKVLMKSLGSARSAAVLGVAKALLHS